MPPKIPNRVSSEGVTQTPFKASDPASGLTTEQKLALATIAVEESFLKHKQSRQSLRSISLSSGSTKRTLTAADLKNMVDDVQIDIDLQRNKRAKLEFELEAARIDTEGFLDKVRAINERDSRLHTRLHDIERARYTQEVEEIEPSLESQNTSMIMNTLVTFMFKDPEAKRKRTQQTQMKDDAIQKYNLFNEAKSRIWDVIIGRLLEKKDAIAAHLVPAFIHPEIVDYICGEGSASGQFKWENCILTTKSIEEALARGLMVIVPGDLSENPVKTWVIRAADHSAINTILYDYLKKVFLT
jgi:hypothetical protein